MRNFNVKYDDDYYLNLQDLRCWLTKRKSTISLRFPELFVATPNGLHTSRSVALTSIRAPDNSSLEISEDTNCILHNVLSWLRKNLLEGKSTNDRQ